MIISSVDYAGIPERDELPWRLCGAAVVKVHYYGLNFGVATQRGAGRVWKTRIAALNSIGVVLSGELYEELRLWPEYKRQHWFFGMLRLLGFLEE